jgi:hypothetical protein
VIVLFFTPLNVNKDIEGVYKVAFRMLNQNKSNVLYYNYYYNPVFCGFLFIYLSKMRKIKVNCVFIEFGNLLSIIDIDLLKKYITVSDFPEYFKFVNYCLVIKYLENTHPKNYKIFGLANKFILNANKDRIIKLIDFMCKNQYIEFLKEVYKDSNKEINFIYSNDKDHYLLKGCVFVVNQIGPIIRDFEKIGYIVSQGPQSSIGFHNTSSALLNIMDFDFRDFLFKENYAQYEKGNITDDKLLIRDKFSINHVHRNLYTFILQSTERQVVSVFLLKIDICLKIKFNYNCKILIF